MSRFLPWEMVFYILLRVPVESLVAFKVVCKTWYAIIKDPEFIESHLRRSISQNHLHYFWSNYCKGYPKYTQTIYSIVSEEECTWKAHKKYLLDEIQVSNFKLKIDCACNGLLCLSPSDFCLLDPIVICNLITGECVRLPATEELVVFHDIWTGGQVRLAKTDPMFSVCYQEIGFGYDHLSKCYKLFRTIAVVFQEEVYTVGEIMTMGESRWTSLDFPHYVYESCGYYTFFFNGSFYWIIEELCVVPSPDNILVFDVHSEKFSTIKFPANRMTWDPVCRWLMNLNGFLGMVDRGEFNTCIWKMIGDNWICHYSVKDMAHPSGICINENMILVSRKIKRSEFPGYHVYIHDMNNGEELEVEVHGVPSGSFVPSLISPLVIINDHHKCTTAN